jgi:hypothetical protein
MRRTFPVLCFLIPALIACGEPRHIGSTMLDVQPRRPTFAGQFDFDLLGQVRGTACLKKSSGFDDDKIIYWLASPAFKDIPNDSRGPIAAAALNAIDNLAGADTIVVTRVVTEPKGNDEVCAYVYGRGIRLTKAVSPAKQVSGSSDEDSDDDTDRDDD